MSNKFIDDEESIKYQIVIKAPQIRPDLGPRLRAALLAQKPTVKS